PAVLAGAGNAAVPDLASAPRAIAFSLNGPPVASYRLHIAVLIESPCVPALNITINGGSGMFYLHPALDLSNGDQGDSFNPAYSAADVEVSFPGGYLRNGDNTITLQPVEDAAQAVPGAGLTYDAIELDAAPNAAASLSAQLEPTIFFEKKNSELEERVDAFLRYGSRVAPGSADLTIAGRHYRLALRGGQAFGEEKLEFLVAEFAPKTQARLIIKMGGHTEHFDQTIDPAKKWTLLIVPHIHVDVGYSDYQAKVAAIQSRAIDEALQMTAAHPDFRFSLDGEWDLQQFLETRTAAEKQRALEAIRDRKIFVPAQYANLLTGIASAETLIRSLYPSANLSRENSSPLDYANITDVPSFTWSYASILASAGISYLGAGSDNYRGPVLLQGRLNESSPMWWEGPDGKRVLLWYSRHYMQMQFLFGLPPLVAAGRDTLPLFLQMYSHSSYRASTAIIFGTQVENTDLFPQQAEIAGEWNSIYAYPHLDYSGFHDAMVSIEKQFDGDLPTIRGDGGPYWEDGAASDAYFLAMERNNEARGLTAEKFSTLAALANPRFAANPAELGRMWTQMVLMDEHTWDSYNSVSDPSSSEAVDQLAIKDRFAVNAAADADWIARRSMANLANLISAGRGSLIVFNSLNWKRSGLVEVDLNKGDEIVDTVTNQPVPFETLSSGSNFLHARFMAEDVPAFGYRVYAMRRAQNTQAAQTEQPGTTLENAYYKIELDPETGAVRSIYDKQIGRELVSQQSAYRFGQYLYVTGGDKLPNTLLHYDRISPGPDLEVHPASGGRLVSVVRTPFGEEARMESQSVNTPSIRTTILLFDNQKKIEFVEELDKKSVESKEAAYFAFPFAMSAPEFHYEIQNGVVDPAKDMYPGAGHEWFSVQHWVSAEQDGVAGAVMPLDAPLVTLGDINRGAWPASFGKRPGTIFSYIMNNYWDTNYRAAQGGSFTFHYIVTSADATRPQQLSRAGWEEATPLEKDIITDQDKALPPSTDQNASHAAEAGSAPAAENAPQLDGRQANLLNIADPDVLLETWKPAEDGNGTILRFLDLGGAERTVTVSSPLLHLKSVTQTDALERGGTPVALDGENQFHFTIHPHEIVTVRAVEARP
ncbi:MAG: glycosyl hydrolase-related protein, partial [Terracidiphilus sp.]